MAVEFNTIPVECFAQIFFADSGYTGIDWEAEIHATGEVILVDKDQNRYESFKQLHAAGVERFTLINHHVVSVDENVDSIDSEISVNAEVGNIVRCVDENNNYVHYEIIEIVLDRMLVRYADLDENNLYRSTDPSTDFYTEMCSVWEILVANEWIPMEVNSE